LSSSISNGTSTVTPSAIVGYQSTRATQNVLHAVIGRGDVDVSFNPTGLRTGTLTMLYSTLALALAAEVFYSATGGKFVLTDGDFGGALTMTHVPFGNIVVAYLDDTAGQGWTLAVDFQEVV
jgi:hypothetical protein